MPEMEPISNGTLTVRDDDGCSMPPMQHELEDRGDQFELAYTPPPKAQLPEESNDDGKQEVTQKRPKQIQRPSSGLLH